MGRLCFTDYSRGIQACSFNLSRFFTSATMGNPSRLTETSKSKGGGNSEKTHGMSSIPGGSSQEWMAALCPTMCLKHGSRVPERAVPTLGRRLVEIFKSE